MRTPQQHGLNEDTPVIRGKMPAFSIELFNAKRSVRGAHSLNGAEALVNESSFAPHLVELSRGASFAAHLEHAWRPLAERS